MDKDRQTYLEQKHATLITPEMVIEDVVKRATGAEVASKKRLIKGEANEVYLVTLVSGKQLILRISHKESNDYQKGADSFRTERQVIEEARMVGAKVPNVVAVEEEVVGGVVRGFCLEEVLPGKPLDECAELSSDQKRGLVAKAGTELAKIHNVHFSGVGELELKDGHLVPWQGSVEDRLLDHERNDQGGLQKIATRLGLPEGTIETCFSLLRDAAARYPSFEPRLLHGDFGPKHIFVDGEEVTGIIDFEEARGGDPVEDIARWGFFFNHTYPTQWLIDGYTDKSIFDDTFAWKMKIWTIHMALSHLYYYDKEKNDQGLAIAKSRLLEVLR